ncbi:hypothetical protein OAJ27_01845 [bacterium]|nr:hypothetical protein [bacterium]
MRSKVECTSCGKICEVPFKPIAGKPIYCNDCFRQKNSDFTEEKSSRFNRESGSNRRSNSDLDQINAKLDRILKLLEE